MVRRLPVTVHQRRSARDPARVRGPNYFLPLRGRKLVTREHVTDFIIQNFRCGAGQRIESVVTQHREIVAQWHACQFHAVHHLHRRKGVNVHAGYHIFHRTQNVAIVKRRQTVRQTTLDADFGCSQIPGFFRLPSHVFEGMKVGISFPRPTAERAKLASDKTNIREIDVAVDHVADDVADQLSTQVISRNQQGYQIIPPATGQAIPLVICQARPVLTLEHALQRAANFHRCAGRNFVPGERRELFQWIFQCLRGHNVLLSKQIVRRGPYKLCCFSIAWTIRKPSNDTSRRASQLAACQSSGASQFVGDGVYAGMHPVAMRIAPAAIVNQWPHPGDADRNFCQSFTPWTPETVADDHGNLDPQAILQLRPQPRRRPVRILRQQYRMATAIHVGDVHAAVGANEPVTSLGDQHAPLSPHHATAFPQRQFGDARIQSITPRPDPRSSRRANLVQRYQRTFRLRDNFVLYHQDVSSLKTDALFLRRRQQSLAQRVSRTNLARHRQRKNADFSNSAAISHGKPAHPDSSCGPVSASDARHRRPRVRSSLRDDLYRAQFPANSAPRTADRLPSPPPDAAENYRCRSLAGTSQPGLARLHSSRAPPHPAPAPILQEEPTPQSFRARLPRSKEYPPELPTYGPPPVLYKRQWPFRSRQFPRD